MKQPFSVIVLTIWFALSFGNEGLAQNSDRIKPSRFQVPLTIKGHAPTKSPIAVSVDFRKLVGSDTAVIARDSIRIFAGESPVPCVVRGDLESRGEAVVAWRSSDSTRDKYQLNFAAQEPHSKGAAKPRSQAGETGRGSVAGDSAVAKRAGPIGIGDTFRFNRGEPGPANITPLHSQFLLVDWDNDGLKDLIGWSYRRFEHGQDLEERLGNAVYFLKNIGTKEAPLFAPRRRLLDSQGEYLRSDLLPQNWFVGDWDFDGDPDFWGMGPALWLTWWENTGKRDANGLWILKPGQKVKQLLEESEFREKSPGVLRKRNAWAPRGVRRIDWEGDGDVDLIVGYRKVSRLRVVDTSKGVAPYGTAVMVYDLLENLGTKKEGADSSVEYARPVTLADQTGIVIHGRGHANGSVEYADWDGDGDFDLLFHSETDRPLEGGRLMFCENRGTRAKPLFESPIPIGVKMVDSPFLVDWNHDGRWDLISNGELFENINPKSQVRLSLPAGKTAEPIRGRTEPGTRLPKIATYPKLVSRGIAKQIDPELITYFTISVDWENDGDLDLVGGYHTGLRLFRNRGTTLNPIFDAPEMLQADGKTISMPNWLDPQSDDPSTFGPQGPTEPMYGWLCPTIGDWDGDGDLDLFATGQRWETKYFENIGSREKPIFANGRTVTVNGLSDELAWRSKISIGDLNGDGTMDLVFHSDRDNAFHLGIRKTEQPEPGKLDFDRGPALQLEDNQPVTGWYGGQNNNSDNHTLLVDWDADGDLDLINGSLWAVYYYKNVGTPAAPRFKAHGKFKLNGKDLHVYNHASSFDAADWNEDGKLDLILGTEGPSDQPHGAVLHLFDRQYLDGKLPTVSLGEIKKQ